ncbi:MAG: hypothetical protein QOH92_3091 [Chloroflexota bacterium]|jgi:hypothetical protein|nr:hypothetical protein [Chloroflexota bacterium]
MVLAFVFALGIMSVQFLGLALSAAKVNHAAQEAAFVAGSSLEAAAGSTTPCWAVTGGLAHPQGYADASLCRTILDNVGDLNPDQLSVSVSPTLLNRSKNVPIHVTITYHQPVTSPLLRLFMGETFTISSDAWSQ